MDWIIDGRINLTQIARNAQLSHAGIVDALVQEGLDATAFASFIGAEMSAVRDIDPENYLTDAEYARLSVAAEPNAITRKWRNG